MVMTYSTNTDYTPKKTHMAMKNLPKFVSIYQERFGNLIPAGDFSMEEIDFYNLHRRDLMDLENQSGWWFFTTNPSEQYAKTVKMGGTLPKIFGLKVITCLSCHHHFPQFYEFSNLSSDEVSCRFGADWMIVQMIGNADCTSQCCHSKQETIKKENRKITGNKSPPPELSKVPNTTRKKKSVSLMK